MLDGHSVGQEWWERKVKGSAVAPLITDFFFCTDDTWHIQACLPAKPISTFLGFATKEAVLRQSVTHGRLLGYTNHTMSKLSVMRDPHASLSW